MGLFDRFKENKEVQQAITTPPGQSNQGIDFSNISKSSGIRRREIKALYNSNPNELKSFISNINTRMSEHSINIVLESLNVMKENNDSNYKDLIENFIKTQKTIASVGGLTPSILIKATKFGEFDRFSNLNIGHTKNIMDDIFRIETQVRDQYVNDFDTAKPLEAGTFGNIAFEFAYASDEMKTTQIYKDKLNTLKGDDYFLKAYQSHIDEKIALKSLNNFESNIRSINEIQQDFGIKDKKPDYIPMDNSEASKSYRNAVMPLLDKMNNSLNVLEEQSKNPENMINSGNKIGFESHLDKKEYYKSLVGSYQTNKNTLIRTNEEYNPTLANANRVREKEEQRKMEEQNFQREDRLKRIEEDVVKYTEGTKALQQGGKARAMIDEINEKGALEFFKRIGKEKTYYDDLGVKLETLTHYNTVYKEGKLLGGEDIANRITPESREGVAALKKAMEKVNAIPHLEAAIDRIKTQSFSKSVNLETRLNNLNNFDKSPERDLVTVLMSERELDSLKNTQKDARDIRITGMHEGLTVSEKIKQVASQIFDFDAYKALNNKVNTLRDNLNSNDETIKNESKLKMFNIAISLNAVSDNPEVNSHIKSFQKEILGNKTFLEAKISNFAQKLKDDGKLKTIAWDVMNFKAHNDTPDMTKFKSLQSIVQKCQDFGCKMEDSLNSVSRSLYQQIKEVNENQQLRTQHIKPSI